jgi:Flp pilus assembly protein CpaB
VYWLQRPPYLRRIAALALVVAAIAWDLAEAATEPFPIAARPIARGAPITAEDIDWIEVPAGLFTVPGLDLTAAAVDLAPGEPITVAVLAEVPAIPADWWTVAVGLEAQALPGDEVLLLVTEPPFRAIGVVLTPQVGDAFSLDHRPATIAVPPEAAPLVAAAEQEGRLITAARPAPGRR